LQLTVQDRIDGGITLLMRCPGYKASDDLTVENITVDLYITPRELLEPGPVSEHAAVLVQRFGEDFVIPHLRRFAARCRIENIVPPEAPGKSIGITQN
jgi:hypothetical protein